MARNTAACTVAPASAILLLPLLSSLAAGQGTGAAYPTERTPLQLEEEKAGPKLTPEELEAALTAGLERFERSADDWTLRTTEHWQHHISDVVETFQRGQTEREGHEDQGRERRRRDFSGLPKELWHSYKYGTGVGNREELALHGFYRGRQLKVSGPALDAPPQWQVVSHLGVFFLFGLYPFAGTTRLHIVRTDFSGDFQEHTVKLTAADLRVTPFLHHMRASQGSQLFAFVKRTAPSAGLYPDGAAQVTEQVFCLLVNQSTLETSEVCAPVTLPTGTPTAEILVDVLYDSYTGAETIALFPVRQTHGLVVYRLSDIKFSGDYNLGLHCSIPTNSSVWKVRLFSVADTTYVVITYGDGPLDRMVQVFRHDSNVFSLVQTLAVTSFVIDIEVFSIGFQHYLALGQENRMSLYVWDYAEFHLLQDEPSPLTYRWTVLAVKSCRHEVILAKVFEDSGTGVEFYRHNVRTQQFEAVPSVPCTSGDSHGVNLDCFRRPDDVLDLIELIGVTTDDATYIIIPSKLKQLVLVTVNATVDVAPDPVRLQNERLLDRKARLQARFDSLLEKEKRLESVLSRSVIPGSDQQITGNCNFLSVVTANTLVAPDVALHRVHLPGYAGDAQGLVAPLTELTDKVAALELALITAADRVADVVHADDTSVQISGQKSVVGGVFIESLSASGPVHINTVRGTDLNSTLSNMVRVDSDRLISGTKTITSSLTVTSELTAALLNDRPVSDIVTVDTTQEVTGPLTYAAGALSADSLSVGGLVGGVDTRRLATYNGGDTLPVAASIEYLDADSLTVGLISGRRPEQVFSNVLLTSGGTFTDAVTFDGDVTLADITVNGTLNGEDVGFLSSVIYTDSAQQLEALWLSSAVVAGSLAPQTVDSKPFPGGRYVTRGGSHVISGQKTLNRVVASSVTAAQVDGVPVTQLVTLDTEQTLTSLSVTTGHVLGDLTVGGTIDGVRVAPGWLDHLITNVTETLDADLVFAGGVTHLGNLHAASINGGSAEKVFGGLIVPEPDRPALVTGKKRFTAAVTTDEVTVGGAVNGADPANWLSVSGEQLVVGPLTLAGRGFFASLMVAGRVDGVDITALIQEAIYTDAEHEQLLYGVKAFTDPATMSALLVDGPINSVGAGEVLWTRGTQTITGSHAYLGPVRAGGLHAYGDLLVPDGARVGGLDFSELPSHAATLANDTHTERLVFDRVIVRGDVLTDHLNGVDLRHLTTGVLRRGGGTITGRWRFESLRVNGSVTTAQGAGGYHLGQLRQRVISVSRGGTVRAPVFFERLSVEDGGEVRGKIVLGGVPWEEVLENLASRDRPININASKTFSGGLRVIGQLRSPSLPLQNLLLVNADQIITGTAFFHSDVTIHTGLTVQQPINGRYDVTKIEELFVTDTEEFTIDGSLEIWGDVSISSLRLSGLLAGLDATTILSDAIPLSEDAHLTGHITFVSPARATTLHLLDGLLNGRHLVEFLSTVRLVNEEQVFRYPMTAVGVTLETAEMRNLTVGGFIGGVNFTDVLQRLIYLDGDYAFSGVWTVPELSVAGDLSVLSFNGQSPERLLRLDVTETIEQLVVTGDVVTTGVRNATEETRLNGYSLWREINDRFRLSHGTPQTFMGSLTFTGHVTVRGDVELGGRLNGFNVSQIVTLGTDNDVLANLQFTGPVTADRVVVRGLVDGVNVTQCAATAVYPDGNHTLYGDYAVTTVLLDGFNGEGPIDVNRVRTEVSVLLEQCAVQRNDFNDFFRSQCLAMRGLYGDMRSTYYAVRYFDELQELTWPDLGTIISTLVLEDDYSSEPAVLVTYTRLGSGCPESRLLRFRSDTGLLQPASVPHNCGAVRQWIHLRPGGRLLLVSAAERPPPQCAAPLSAVWRWSNGRVQPLQNLNIAASQAFYTAPRPGAPAQLRLLDPVGGELHQLSFNPSDGSFVAHPPQPTNADLLAVHSLPDGSLLVLSGEGTTVVARRQSPAHTHHGHHEQTLGALTATALFTFSRRGQTMFAVGDGGWSSLVNSPQGVKVFEYFGNGTHRCVPAQHLAAVSPADLTLLSVGSLPDLLLTVVERDCGLRLFVDKGEAGFVEFQRVAVPGAEAVSVLYPQSDSPPHLLVSAGRRLVLLAARMTGAHVTPLSVDCSPRLLPLRNGEGEGRSEERRVEGRSEERRVEGEGRSEERRVEGGGAQ
ncbi:uncharacterized protein LOC122386609 isoform X1 [Amphibalanus amphitrite]|uniref:uncharacterized protein LOC122386609 isoform X1 n=1 Tax=Amphibalanus amphitrite TaxID=1232801 RepID=UPI001C9107CA|nr:uncharacterized protein LOC122386609 isoform X1 [Amphibalanus amphitrite]